MPDEADPNVTIVVATRDRAPELRRGLRRHTGPVLVVDNASTDDTAAVAEAAGATVLRRPRNLGAAARNVGARHTATRYVAFADDDSWWAPGALRRAARILDAHPRTALLAARGPRAARARARPPSRPPEGRGRARPAERVLRPASAGSACPRVRISLWRSRGRWPSRSP
ncbi:glycosyltransferase family 2 protein [Actinomadura litoris]|uniref:glycosyltransferase family 2 protein n=1 Tax=Actinomadura litoris TaxID=2678616 RepID=UPI001FA6FBF2|nr:glycosyltransferase family A protein [Actinomadura litoris]